MIHVNLHPWKLQRIQEPMDLLIDLTSQMRQNLV